MLAVSLLEVEAVGYLMINTKLVILCGAAILHSRRLLHHQLQSQLAVWSSLIKFAPSETN